MELPENGLFVVPYEGGEYQWLSKADWDRQHKRHPIYGAKVGRLMMGRDQILTRYGLPSFWMRACSL